MGRAMYYIVLVLLSKTVSSMDFAVLGLCVLRVCGLIHLFAYVDVQN